MLILGLVLAGGFSAKAQTEEERRIITKDYNHAALLELSKEAGEKAQKERAQAYRLAEVNNWPLKYTTDQGGHAELMGLHPNGQPKYYVTSNVNAAFTSGINSLNTGGDLGLNLNGEGMLAGMWDESSPRTIHNTFSGRLTIQDGAITYSEHATHVMGTIIGNGAGEVAQAKGMAPMAFGEARSWTDDELEMPLAADNGLLVSNHSYGYIAGGLDAFQFGAYASDARLYDQIAYNAPFYLIIQAAGNDRNIINSIPDYDSSKGGYDLINGTKTMKNGITVAAVNGLSNAYSGPQDVVMSAFSSWGPTDDMRIKPDISAKGVNVYSSVINGSSNSTYEYLSGTSMASPVVTGGALLLQQLYSQENGNYMRAATLRGLICHTAHEAGDADGPDAKFGWGLFNAKKAAQTIINNGVNSIIEEKTLSNGGEYEFNVIATGSEPLIVSATWTDPAGPANNNTIDSSVSRLVNNLDVRVSQNGTDYLPWKLGATNSAAAVKGDNNADNIERIDVLNAAGQYTVKVSHKNNLSGGPQNYSIIVTGASKVAGLNDVTANLFSVWPNPASSQVNISLGAEASSPADYVFYDIQGRVVLSGALTGALNTINIERLNAGIYVVKVVQNGNEQTKKVVINK